MRKIALTLSAAALALAGTVSALSAHQTGPMMQNRAAMPFDAQAMGPGMMYGGGAMFGPGMMGPGMMMGGGMMGHGMMHMMTVMMDADGDGAVSSEEFQAVHARMFDAMDLDGDGKLTSDEMQEFMWSGSPAGAAEQ